MKIIIMNVTDHYDETDSSYILSWNKSYCFLMKTITYHVLCYKVKLSWELYVCLPNTHVNSPIFIKHKEIIRYMYLFLNRN